MNQKQFIHLESSQQNRTKAGFIDLALVESVDGLDFGGLSSLPHRCVSLNGSDLAAF